MKTKIFTKILQLSCAIGVITTAAVQAIPYTYDYTGNLFTSVSGAYTTSDSITGSVTLANPLKTSMPLTTVTPISFSFFDGVDTITDANATSSLFRFATNSTGITQWYITLEFDPPGVVIQDINTYSLGIGTGIYSDTGGYNQASAPFFGDGSVSNPGAWTGTVVPDTGSTFGFLLLSVTVMGGVARWLKPAAA
jgi:hypothetical protein